MLFILFKKLIIIYFFKKILFLKKVFVFIKIKIKKKIVINQNEYFFKNFTSSEHAFFKKSSMKARKNFFYFL